MKTKFKIPICAARCSFGGVICAGAVLLVAPTAQAQNLFVSIGPTIYEFTPGGAYSTFATQSGNALELAFNSAGDLFVPNTGNGTITEISPSGTQSTFASGLETPTALAFNSAGDLFVADAGTGSNGNIYEYTPDGVRSTFASGLSVNYGLAFNSADNLFGSSEKFVLFIGWTDMLVGHGRDIVDRGFWCIQELLFYQDGDQTRRRVYGGRAFGETLLLSRVPQPRCDS